MFSQFSKAVHANFTKMSKGELFTVRMPNDLADMYLASFPAGTNPIFRVRGEYDCTCCKHFVRRLGHVVAIVDGKLQTIWDGLDDLPEPFKSVAAKLGHIVRSQPIEAVFRTKEHQFGVDHNYDSKTNQRYEHFHGVVDRKHRCDDAAAKVGELNDTRGMLKRGLEEFKVQHFVDVLDLIDSNGVYRGAEFRAAINDFRELLVKYDKSELFTWANVHHKQARLRGTAVGQLFIDLAEGKDFGRAIESFGKMLDPRNYKRPTSVITQGMVEKAIKTLNDLQLQGALARRFARLSDVSVNNVLFVANDTKLKDNVAAILESAIAKDPVSVKHAIPISAEGFLRTVLPGAKQVEVLVENRHSGNFVSLTGGDGPERLFKWNNNFAWCYDGDVADSVKARVKAAGGNIHAKLRVSLSWFNIDDLDLHAKTPSNAHIFYGNKMGILDVDMNVSMPVRNAVENLAFQTLTDGVYEIGVHNFNHRENVDIGFAIEVEFGGVISQYSYSKVVRGMVDAMKLHVKGGKLERIETTLSGGNVSQEKWGVKTETLVPVAAVLNSPNHWEAPIGAKHLIFALKGCTNPGQPRGFLNEQLRSDLEQHRKVFEVLGSRMKCPASAEQVSGIGFTAGRNDSVTVVVDGRRAYNVSF